MKKRMLLIILVIVAIVTFLIPITFANAEVTHTSLFGGTVTKKVTCGNLTNIPRKIPEITRMVINIVQIAVPIILIIVGSIDLFKGIVSQKEDEIKKGQQMFVKRLIISVAIFFISLVADASNTSNIVECVDCFFSSSSSCKSS